MHACFSGTVKPGFNFKRDTSSSSSSAADAAHGDCEGSAIIPILSGFSGAGFADFKAALVERMGADWLNTVVSDNFTATS
jgi:sphingomyelin phosphodiesterase